jgi:hypothetical protein
MLFDRLWPSETIVMVEPGMTSHADLHRRLDAVAARPDLRLSELEDLLTEGYARALDAEAQSRRLEQRLAQLLPEIDKPGVSKEIRRLTLQRRTVDQAVSDLRAKLARVRACITPASGRPSRSA